jgi:hypothetical protein
LIRLESSSEALPHLFGVRGGPHHRGKAGLPLVSGFLSSPRRIPYSLAPTRSCGSTLPRLLYTRRRRLYASRQLFRLLESFPGLLCHRVGTCGSFFFHTTVISIILPLLSAPQLRAP